jgi:hypothetical protein
MVTTVTTGFVGKSHGLLMDDPLRDVPAKFWDLNTRNGASLNLAAGLVRIEPKTFLDKKTLYLIHPVDTSRDSLWVLAVDAMTALECVWDLTPPTLPTFSLTEAYLSQRCDA